MGAVRTRVIGQMHYDTPHSLTLPMTQGRLSAVAKPSANGRDAKSGQFVKGNPGGPGNPHARKASELRAALYAAVTDDDVAMVARKLVVMAADGNEWAIEFFFDRVIPAETAAPAESTDPKPERTPEQKAMLISRAERALERLTTH